MDTFQASDVEDWGRLERAKAILGAITVPDDVLQTEGGDASRIKIPKEDIPLLKEKLYRKGNSNDRPSKKKRRSNKDGSKKPSSSRGQEVGNVSEALYPKI